jgi:hypothetical protein
MPGEKPHPAVARLLVELDPELGDEDVIEDIGGALRSAARVADTMDDLQQAVAEQENLINDLSGRVADLEDDGRKSGMREKAHAVGEYALQKGDAFVSAKEIQGVAGVSQRYAYKMCDPDETSYAETFSWWMPADEATANQYGSLEIDKDDRDSWTDTAGVVIRFNEFKSVSRGLSRDNNETTQEGAD